MKGQLARWRCGVGREDEAERDLRTRRRVGALLGFSGRGRDRRGREGRSDEDELIMSGPRGYDVREDALCGSECASGRNIGGTTTKREGRRSKDRQYESRFGDGAAWPAGLIREGPSGAHLTTCVARVVLVNAQASSAKYQTRNPG